VSATWDPQGLNECLEPTNHDRPTASRHLSYVHALHGVHSASIMCSLHNKYYISFLFSIYKKSSFSRNVPHHIPIITSKQTVSHNGTHKLNDFLLNPPITEPCTMVHIWRVVPFFSLYRPWTLVSCQVFGYVPLGGQVHRFPSLCLSLAQGGSPANVRQITFQMGYLKFCFGYSSWTGYTGYSSLSRMCHHLFCSLAL
jgi:hypothetical protein